MEGIKVDFQKHKEKFEKDTLGILNNLLNKILKDSKLIYWLSFFTNIKITK